MLFFLAVWSGLEGREARLRKKKTIGVQVYDFGELV